MVGTIYLDINTGVQRSTITLSLSKRDINDLYQKEFVNACPLCHSALGDSTGDICCRCFKIESRNHTDCCLAEEEEK